MNFSGYLANRLLRLPSNRILDHVISKLLSRQRYPIAVAARYRYLLYVGGEDPSVNSLRIAVALGHYEAGYFRILERLIEPGSVIIDVGANEGYVSLYLSSLVGSHGHVYSFEPNSRNVARIEENVRLNQRTNITVVGKAVSDTTGISTLHGDGAWGTLIESAYPSAPSTLVETTTLDAHFGNERSLASLHLVKIDVEGHELQVVQGARSLFLRTRPIVCFEVNLTLLAYSPFSVQDLFQFFLGNQYVLFVEENGELERFEWLKRRVMNVIAIPMEHQAAGRSRSAQEQFRLQ